MAFSEALVRRIRKAVEHQTVEEKKMFGSLAFLVNGKICLTAGPERMMCRIDPKLHEQEVKRNGCATAVMRGRNYKGYIHVQEENLQNEKDFNHWVNLALVFNKQLISS
ncbi:TfoX/Sxy family protein [Gelidibacter salicanalis]|uniref:TfoX/Sxy family protein n=1 Tax=Gelidibacter salicanalis TaxID=291193 RepID=A0A934KMG1_9FLAO|nr:TfoX/Sxy family protein [Gelidibacter salicanalis]MBJ7881917.1 TfoX/Sxy family protein [Gelidibacter salicanalis]